MLDWARGSYEETAKELLPVAEHLIELAAISAGERLLVTSPYRIVELRPRRDQHGD